MNLGDAVAKRWLLQSLPARCLVIYDDVDLSGRVNPVRNPEGPQPAEYARSLTDLTGGFSAIRVGIGEAGGINLADYVFGYSASQRELMDGKPEQGGRRSEDVGEELEKAMNYFNRR